LRPQKFFVRNFFRTHMHPVRPPGGTLEGTAIIRIKSAEPFLNYYILMFITLPQWWACLCVCMHVC